MLFSFIFIKQISKLGGFTSDGFTQMNVSEEAVSFEVANDRAEAVVIFKCLTVNLLKPRITIQDEDGTFSDTPKQ